MTKRKLKPFAVSMIYVISAVMLVLSMYFIQGIIENTVLKDKESTTEQTGIIIEDIITDKDNEVNTNTEDIPVVNTDSQIIKPYMDESIKIAKNYYDYQSDNTTQENSIIYYENTYMQNSGVDYAGSSEFDVVSILDGTVVSVSEDDILGTTIQIKHSNDLVSVYQSMGTVNVKENDVVTQGTIIGKSGESNISKDLGNHLHFELYRAGSVVNPEEYYGKLLGELN